jgi:hypothetical protein
MLTIQLAETFTDSGLTVMKRDKVIENDNSGVLFLADFSRKYSWAAATPPANGATIASLTEANNASMVVNQAPSLAGNGLDFSALTARGTNVEIPASVYANIWGTGAEAHYFLICQYVKLPIQADWNANTGTVAPFFAGNAQYTVAADLALMTQSFASSLARVSFLRQTAVGGATTIGTLTPPAYGALAQLALWRNADGHGCRIKMAAGEISATAAVGSNNSANFSAVKGHWGVSAANYWNTPLGTQANAVKWRAYRLFIENLRVSGRNPITVLDADYARVTAHGLFT